MSAFPKRGGALIFMTNLEIIKKLQQTVKEKPYEYQAVEGYPTNCSSVDLH